MVKHLKKTQSIKGEFEKPSYLLQTLIALIDSLGFFKSYSKFGSKKCSYSVVNLQKSMDFQEKQNLHFRLKKTLMSTDIHGRLRQVDQVIGDFAVIFRLEPFQVSTNPRGETTGRRQRIHGTNSRTYLSQMRRMGLDYLPT